MYVMLVTCMGRVSCYTCCGQSITVQVCFNWPSVRFLHILLALLHLMFHFVSLFIVFVYSLPLCLLFSISTLIIFLFYLLPLFYPPLFCLLPCWRFVLPPHLQAPKSEKMKQGKRNNEKRKEKNSLVNYLFMTPHSREEPLHSLPGYLHLC